MRKTVFTIVLLLITGLGFQNASASYPNPCFKTLCYQVGGGAISWVKIDFGCDLWLNAHKAYNGVAKTWVNFGGDLDEITVPMSATLQKVGDQWIMQLEGTRCSYNEVRLYIEFDSDFFHPNQINWIIENGLAGWDSVISYVPYCAGAPEELYLECPRP